MNIIFDNLCIVHLVGGFFCENAVYLYDLTNKEEYEIQADCHICRILMHSCRM